MGVSGSPDITYDMPAVTPTNPLCMNWKEVTLNGAPPTAPFTYDHNSHKLIISSSYYSFAGIYTFLLRAELTVDTSIERSTTFVV